MTFDELGLSDKVREAVKAAGFETPTPIQAQAIPPALERRDVLGLAQTGSGKTAAFALPMLTMLEKGRARARMPRSLVLEPTRELAVQVHEAFERLGRDHKLTIALLIGGVSFGEQNAKIDRGADIVIATPGRLLDHLERGRLMLHGIEVLVVDEADRMLDMGFIPDVEKICRILPITRQTLFFSATMPAEIQRLTNQFLHNPVVVESSPPSSTAASLIQRAVWTPSDPAAKRAKLRELLHLYDNIKNAIVFSNRKITVAALEKSLKRHGFNAAALHGDMDQFSRLKTLEAFRNGEVTYLIASDVAARGLDIPQVSHVFNFDVPVSPEDYVHRVGRTGRAGREGHSFTLVTPEDLKTFHAIEALIQMKVEWQDHEPSEDEVAEAMASRRRGRGGARGAGKSAAAPADKGGRRGSRGKAAAKAESAEPSKQARQPEAVPAENVAKTADEARSSGDRHEPRQRRERKAAESRQQQPDERKQHPERKRGGRDRDGDGGEPLGFHAGNMPAFLARPPVRT